MSKVRIVKEEGSMARHVFVDDVEIKNVRNVTVQYLHEHIPTIWIELTNCNIDIDESEAEVQILQ